MSTIASLIINVAANQAQLVDQMRQVNAALDNTAAASSRTAAAMQTDLTRIAGATTNVSSTFTSLMGVARATAGALGIGFGAGAIVNGIVSIGRSAMQSADQFSDLHSKTRLSMRTLQEMDYVAGQTGGSLDGFAQAAFKLGTTLAGGGTSVQAAVQKLGLSFREIAALDPDTQFRQIVGALGQVESAQERNRLGTELFGKSFKDMAAAVTEGWSQMADQAVIASDTQIEALGRAADAWSGFVKNMKAGAMAPAAAVASWLMPTPQGDPSSRMTVLGGRASALDVASAETAVLQGLTGTAAAFAAQLEASMHPVKSYQDQLKALDEQLKLLIATQGKEIEAALALGVSAQELGEKYPVLVDHLGRYNTLSRDAAEATKAHDREMKEAAKTADQYADGLAALRRIEQTRPGSVPGGIPGLVPDILTPPEPYDTGFEQGGLPYITAAAARGIGGQTIGILQEIPRIVTAWDQAIAHMRDSTADAFGDMLTGIRGFKDGMLDIWRSIQQSISQYISSIVRQWLGGLMQMGGASQGFAGAAVGGLGGMVGGGPGGSMQSIGGGGGGAGGGAGMGNFGAFNQATGTWARYGSGALVGGVAGFSTGYATGSRGAGIASGAISGAMAGMGGGVYGMAIGAGVGALAGYFGAELGKGVNAEKVDAARRQWLSQFGPNGGYAVQQALGIFGTGNASSDGLRLWREFSGAKDFETLNRTGSAIASYMNVYAQGPAPDMRRPIGSLNGQPIYSFANEAFNLTRPTMAIVGDANEPEHVVKDSTLRRLSGGNTEAITRFMERFDRYMDDAPRQTARAMRDALVLAGVTR